MRLFIYVHFIIDTLILESCSYLWWVIGIYSKMHDFGIFRSFNWRITVAKAWFMAILIHCWRNRDFDMKMIYQHNLSHNHNLAIILEIHNLQHQIEISTQHFMIFQLHITKSIFHTFNWRITVARWHLEPNTGLWWGKMKISEFHLSLPTQPFIRVRSFLFYLDTSPS